MTPATLPGFPTGVTAGSYSIALNTESASTYTTSFVTAFGGGTVVGAATALLNGLLAGRAYLNIHSTTFTGGEIRGFLAEVPEPASAALLGAGLLGLCGLRRRPRRAA